MAVMLAFGVLGFLMVENGIPVAPAILGVVLGKMMEENFITSMIKSDDDLSMFVTRPIAMWLAIATALVLLWPAGSWALRRLRAMPMPH